jgi:hypothetical protein
LREAGRLRQCGREGDSSAPVPDDRAPLKFELDEHGRVGRVAKHAPVANDKRVDGRFVRLDELRDAELVGRRDVRAREAKRNEASHGVLQLVGDDAQRHVRPVEPSRREGGVLHEGRQRLRDRIAEQPDQSGLTGDQGP